VFNVPGNRICWGYGVRLENPEEAKRQQFANSEWGPESIEPMIKQVYDKPCPYTKEKKMGDLIDATQRSTISKVFLEHKLFNTWFHGRTVLIGDGKGDYCLLSTCSELASRGTSTMTKSTLFSVLF